MNTKLKKSSTNYVVSRNAKELAEAIGLKSESEIILMIYKAELSQMATKAISKSNLSVNQLVKLSGVARSKVSAIKNGALSSISCDLFIKVIVATGAKIKFKMAS